LAESEGISQKFDRKGWGFPGDSGKAGEQREWRQDLRSPALAESGGISQRFDRKGLGIPRGFRKSRG
jgi:hypothetical protein